MYVIDHCAFACFMTVASDSVLVGLTSALSFPVHAGLRGALSILDTKPGKIHIYDKHTSNPSYVL